MNSERPHCLIVGGEFPAAGHFAHAFRWHKIFARTDGLLTGPRTSFQSADKFSKVYSALEEVDPAHYQTLLFFGHSGSAARLFRDLFSRLTPETLIVDFSLLKTPQVELFSRRRQQGRTPDLIPVMFVHPGLDLFSATADSFTQFFKGRLLLTAALEENSLQNLRFLSALFEQLGLRIENTTFDELDRLACSTALTPKIVQMLLQAYVYERAAQSPFLEGMTAAPEIIESADLTPLLRSVPELTVADLRAFQEKLSALIDRVSDNVEQQTLFLAPTAPAKKIRE